MRRPRCTRRRDTASKLYELMASVKYEPTRGEASELYEVEAVTLDAKRPSCTSRAECGSRWNVVQLGRLERRPSCTTLNT